MSLTLPPAFRTAVLAAVLGSSGGPAVAQIEKPQYVNQRFTVGY